VTSRSLLQSGPTKCGASECDRGTSQMRQSPTGSVETWKKKEHICYLAVLLQHVSAPTLAGLHTV